VASPKLPKAKARVLADGWRYRHSVQNHSASAGVATPAGCDPAADRSRTLHAIAWGALAKACNYTLTLWERLTRFLEYSELELSNNLAENSMRPASLGRKNWVHVRSVQAGPKIAAIVFIVESCRR